MGDTRVVREAELKAPNGLHLRTAMVLSQAAQGFGCRIRIASPVAEVDGKSLLDLLRLQAVCGTRLRVEAEGEGSEAAVARLVELIESTGGESAGAGGSR